MKKLLPLFFALAVSCCSPLPCSAGEVSYFRAGGGAAERDERPLPDDLTAKDVQLWRQPLEPGHSSPCVIGDSIYLTTFNGKELATVALARQTGQVRWRQVAPAERIEPYHPTGSPAASTPACDGRRLYVFFGSYGLLCYDLEGKLLWSKPLGPFRDEFGSASSPVLVDGKVILCEDHDLDSFLMALDAETGETVWKTAREGFTRSYSTPVVWEADGKRQIVVSGALQLMAYDVADGKKLWSLDGFARIVNTTPTIAEGLLYVCTWSPGGDSDARIAMEPWSIALRQWDKNGDQKISNDELPAGEVRSRFFRIDLNQDLGIDEPEWNKYAKIFELAQNNMLALRPSGTGELGDSSIVWQYNRGLPYVPSPLVYRGVVYLVKDGGVMTCLDAATGRLLKQGRAQGPGPYLASPVAGDGKVYLASDHGMVTVLKAGVPFETLSSRDFQERLVATPVIADGRIYVRTEKALYALGK